MQELIIRVVELIVTCTTMLIYECFSHKNFDAKLPHRFFECVFFGSMLVTVLFLIAHWMRYLSQNPRTLLKLETVTCTIVACGYIIAALLTEPSSEAITHMIKNQMPDLDNRLVKENGLLTCACLFSGMWFSLHSILSTDMSVTHYEENINSKDAIQTQWFTRNTNANAYLVNYSLCITPVSTAVLQYENEERKKILKQMLGTKPTIRQVM